MTNIRGSGKTAGSSVRALLLDAGLVTRLMSDRVMIRSDGKISRTKDAQHRDFVSAPTRSIDAVHRTQHVKVSRNGVRRT